MKEIVIGTRGSELALWQADFITSQLKRITDLPIKIKIIKTQGDMIQHLSFEKMEGKGFFTKEIEEALLDNEIDLAVHSLKDLMTAMPDGLLLAAVGFREDNREAVLIRKESFDEKRALKIVKNGIIGSSSVRRQSQITDISPDLQMKDLRGNVPTRINKLREGQYDAIIIAYAGIKRLDLNVSDLEINLLDFDHFLPAPGQGILGIQTRQNAADVNKIVGQLEDPAARRQTELERGLLARFDGGCQLPLGAYSEIDRGKMNLKAVLGVYEGGKWTRLNRAEASGTDPISIVDEVYGKLGR